MRALALVLLLLINTFSLPLQAMNDHVMSAYIPCNMKTMPAMMTKMAMAEQHSADVNTDNDCQMNDMSMHGDLTTMPEDSCDMSNSDHCSTASSLPFISINLFIVANRAQTTTVLYTPASFPEQHPENLYRPPLIS